MEPHRFTHLITDGVDWRQRGHRLLKNDRNAPSADCPHLRAVGRQLCEVDGRAIKPRIGKQNLTTRDYRAARQDAKDRLADDRFSRAGFADQRHSRAGADAK